MPLPFKLQDGTMLTTALVEMITWFKSADRTHKWLSGEVSVFAIELVRSDPDLWGKRSTVISPKPCENCGRLFQPSRFMHLRRYCSPRCAK
jgi:hypothetical protein